MVKFGKFADDAPGEQSQVFNGNFMFGVRQAGGVFKVGIMQADFFGGLIHHRGKFRFRTGKVFGDDDAGIVAGLDENPFQEVFNPDFLSDFQKHGRPAGGCAALAPGVFADGKFVVKGNFAVLKLA